MGAVKALIGLRPDLNKADSYKMTPLHIAAQFGHLEAVKALIKARANLYLQDDVGRPPLHVAAENGRLEVVEFLIKARRVQISTTGTDVNLTNKLGKTPLHVAAENGRLEVVEFLITAGAGVNLIDHAFYTPLDYAILRYEQQEVITILK